MIHRSLPAAAAAVAITFAFVTTVDAKPARPPATRPSPPPASQVLDAASGQALVVVQRGVFSTSNANDQYVAVVELATQPSAGPALVFGAQRLVAHSWGSGYGQGKGAAHWEVDRATADAIAAAWQVTRQDRVSLDPGLTLRCRPKQASVRRGKPMPMVLELVNAGTTTVGFQDGGRHFGRDEQFAFTASRGGGRAAGHPARPGGGWRRLPVQADRAGREGAAGGRADRLDQADQARSPPDHVRVPDHAGARHARPALARARRRGLGPDAHRDDLGRGQVAR
jgi:hypothetical protein